MSPERIYTRWAVRTMTLVLATPAQARTHDDSP